MKKSSDGHGPGGHGSGRLTAAGSAGGRVAGGGVAGGGAKARELDPWRRAPADAEMVSLAGLAVTRLPSDGGSVTELGRTHLGAGLGEWKRAGDKAMVAHDLAVGDPAGQHEGPIWSVAVIRRKSFEGAEVDEHGLVAGTAALQFEQGGRVPPARGRAPGVVTPAPRGHRPPSPARMTRATARPTLLDLMDPAHEARSTPVNNTATRSVAPDRLSDRVPVRGPDRASAEVAGASWSEVQPTRPCRWPTR